MKISHILKTIWNSMSCEYQYNMHEALKQVFVVSVCSFTTHVQNKMYRHVSQMFVFCLAPLKLFRKRLLRRNQIVPTIQKMKNRKKTYLSPWTIAECRWNSEELGNPCRAQ